MSFFSQSESWGNHKGIIKSTRVSFQGRFIHWLHVGVGTLPRVFFITRYPQQNHLACEHQNLTWLHLNRVYRVHLGCHRWHQLRRGVLALLQSWEAGEAFSARA